MDNIARYIITFGNGETKVETIGANAVVYVVRGRVRILYNGFSAEAVEGQVLLLETGIYQLQLEDCELVVFNLKPTHTENIIHYLSTNYNISPTSNHNCEMCDFHNFVIATPSEVVAEFFKSCVRLFELEEFNEQTQKLKLSELLYLILSGENECLKSRILKMLDAQKNRFRQIVFDNIFANISIAQMASKSCLSTSAFKREFEHNFDISPHKWAITQRLQHAENMLHTTSRPISEIARLCSFNNLSHFSKRFRLHYGLTPRDYRKKKLSDSTKK